MSAHHVEIPLGTATHVTGRYRFEILEGVSHWIPEEVPERLSRLRLDHLADQ